jgi:hypothetical protein
MGETVLFLDGTVLPSKCDNQIEVTSSEFCGHLWKNDFLQIDCENVRASLETFYQDKLSDSFGVFLSAVSKYTRSSGNRVWMIVDEAVLFENFPIDLPKEQRLGPFNWIVTGSAGIGSWVAKRHLKKWVFDLPLFTKEECSEFANNLCSSLKINLKAGICGVPQEGMADWLEERFGGVIGYITELFLEISNGKKVSQYISSLVGRVNDIISHTAERRHISTKQLAEDWLNVIKSPLNDWKCFRDAGLCGSSPPRGIIFSLILQWLYTLFPEQDALSLVVFFRSKFSGDPGLDGCLLELQEILKLRASNSLGASLLTSTDKGWTVQESIDLPPRGTLLNVMVYQESHSRLKDEAPNSTSSPWTLILVPSGFDVIDVALVRVSVSPAIYGIQITRSATPFAKHHTIDTCPPRSKERLATLWSVISDHFKLNDPVEKFYVMLAPNCERDQFRPPGGHASDYYFAPSRIVTEYNPPNSRKRNRHPVPTLLPPSKKKCCRCSRGKCTSPEKPTVRP